MSEGVLVHQSKRQSFGPLSFGHTTLEPGEDPCQFTLAERQRRRLRRRTTRESRRPPPSPRHGAVCAPRALVRRRALDVGVVLDGVPAEEERRAERHHAEPPLGVGGHVRGVELHLRKSPRCSF